MSTSTFHREEASRTVPSSTQTVSSELSSQTQLLPHSATARPARLRATLRSTLLSILPALLVAALLLVVWYSVTAARLLPSIILPAPGDVFSSLIDGFSSGLFLSNLWVTMQESLLGFLVALLISLPLGYALAKFRLFAVAFHPYLAAGQAIPVLAIAPLLSIWLGYGLFTNVVVSFLVVFFPLVVNAMLGLQLIDRSLTDAARVEGADGWSLLLHIEFPLALPPIMAAFRTCLTLAVVGALVAEFVIGGDQGLGSLVLEAKNQYNLPLMFASLLVLAALAALYYGLAWLLTKLTEALFA
ncbi:MAG TPA: ABC transporter permease [Ktedonobacteraceae bacterium]|jgi:NitT/TauT family transport system permease protein|nr:ABC transporter permease [Ktedonobacteraceae bacterium]